MTFSYDDITPEHCAACIKWVTKMSTPTEWDLTISEVAILLGMNVSEYVETQNMASESLPFLLRAESAERISLLLGISKRLHLLGLDEKTSISAFNRINNGKLMKGKSIKNFLLEENSLPAFYAVNLYIESSKVDD
jgi:hypothetical protein